MLEAGVVRWRWAFALIGLSALAILTRLSGWAVLGFNLLVFLFAVGHTLWEARKRAKRGQLRAALLGLGLLLVTIAGVAAFNYNQYGTVFGRYRQLDDLVVRAIGNFNLPLETVAGVFNQTQVSYETPLTLLTTRRTFLVVYSLAVVTSISGAFLGLVLATVRRWRKQDSPNLGAYLLLTGALGVGVALVLFRNMLNVTEGGGVTLYNTATIFAPLRYYNAALPPLALLLSVGLLTMVEPIRVSSHATLQRILSANPLGIGLALLWMVVTLLGVAVLVRQRAGTEVIDIQTLQSMENFTAVSAADGDDNQPDVLGYVAEPNSAQGVVNLTIYARQVESTTLNYAAQVDMMVDGSVMNSCQFLPARGFYPTTLWSSQSAVKFSSAVPNCAGAINDPIDLSLRWLGADVNGVIQEETEPLLLGTVDPPLAQIPETCPTALGIFAEGYRLTQFNSPSSVGVGDTYLPSANWIVTQPSPDVAGRIFLFTHEETGEQYPCAAGDNPASSWVLGEYKFFDRCPMTFPAEAALGDYTVSMVMVNAAGERLPATDAAGEPMPNNAVRIGTVTLEE
jgi:hypothetical protein